MAGEIEIARVMHDLDCTIELRLAGERIQLETFGAGSAVSGHRWLRYDGGFFTLYEERTACADFFTDRTPPADLGSVYDRQAPTWLRGPGRVETWLVGADMRNELVDSLRGDVLEIGVGAGDTLLRLSQRRHQLTSFTGVDLSPGMIVEAGKVSANFPIRLLVANAEDLSQLPDDSFDTVTASLVFCTVPDVPKAFAEIARVTRPDGQVVLLEHVLSTNRVVAKLQRWASPSQIRMIGCHLDRSTEQTLVDCGYTINRSRYRRLGVVRLMIATPPPG